jgi:hypothetical protein
MLEHPDSRRGKRQQNMANGHVFFLMSHNSRSLRIDSSFEIAPMQGAVGGVGGQEFSQKEYTMQSESKKVIVNVFVSSF